jgi:pyruvate formate lyase activating enzyme
VPILRNLHLLSDMGVPFIIRVPLVPGVTDTNENLAAIAETVRDLPGLVRVDLLPYNKLAGAKYRAVDMEFIPGFDESREPHANTAIFEKVGLNVKVT